MRANPASLGLVAAALFVLVFSFSAWGSEGREGAGRIYLGMWLLDPPVPGTTVRISVFAHGAYELPTLGSISIRMPPGLALISGDTTRSVRLDSDSSSWQVRVRIDQSGRQKVIGTATADFGPTLFEITASSLTFDAAETTRVLPQPRVDIAGVRWNNQWYRNGGAYLVPVDSDEVFSQGLLEKDGVRGKVITRTTVRDSIDASVPSTGLDIPCVLFIAADGSLRDLRLRGSRAKDAFLKEVILNEIRQHWVLAGGQYDGRSVSDYAEVLVHVSRP